MARRVKRSCNRSILSLMDEKTSQDERDASGIDVLIVDDAALIRHRFAAMLQRIRGVATIREAASVEEGIARAEERAPDLLLLDISMPGGSGLDVLPVVKKLDRPPVVAVLTNYPYDEYRLRCAELGADYFFDKTSEFHKVAELVRVMVRSDPGAA